MSNNVNSKLEERAQEMVEVWAGTLVADAILLNLERGDLEKVQYLVAQAEAETAREHFYNYNLIGGNDVY